MAKIILNILQFCIYLGVIYALSHTFFWFFLGFLFLFTGWILSTPENSTSNKKNTNTGNSDSTDEFQQRLDNGEIRTYDDVVYHNGSYYENENSEEWEDFEYQYEEDHRR